MAIKKDTIAIDEIRLSVLNQVENAEIKVTHLDNPPDVEELKGDVYQFDEIEKVNIGDTDISEITISFKVEKSWLRENGVLDEDVVLKKYTSRWINLPTIKKDSDEVYTYYESNMRGFSFFAITAEKPIIEKEPGTELASEAAPAVGETHEGSRVPSPAEEVKEPVTGRKDWIYYTIALMILALVIVALVMFWMGKKPKKKDKKGKSNLVREKLGERERMHQLKSPERAGKERVQDSKKKEELTNETESKSQKKEINGLDAQVKE